MELFGLACIVGGRLQWLELYDDYDEAVKQGMAYASEHGWELLHDYPDQWHNADEDELFVFAPTICF